MPEIDRQLHDTKVISSTQIGLPMASLTPIEFDKRPSPRACHFTQHESKNMDFTVFFYIFFITN
jgi:hypothetical protein